MTIYNSTNNISEDYTFIIDINEILYTQEELNTLNLNIYQYSSSQDNITWNTVNSSDIDDIYAILSSDLADLSNPNILDITADFSKILEESQEYNGTVLIYCGIQDDNRNGFPDFDDNQYFILVIHRNPESYYCIPIKSHILDNNIQIVNVETFEPLDFEYLSAKQVQNLIYSLISKMEILEFVETLPPKSSARTNCVYLLTETPSDPTDLVDDGLNLNFGLYAYSKTINDYKKLDTLTFNIKNFVKKTDIIDNLTSTVVDAPLSAKQGKILNDNLASHTHGNIANDGKIRTSNNSNKNVVTDASGKITIENKPKIPSKTSDLVNDGSDGSNIFVSNNDNRLSDNRNPLMNKLFATSTNLVDLNNVTDAGFYVVISYGMQYVSNLPADDLRWDIFYLFTLKFNDAYILQFIMSYRGDKSYVRAKKANEWNAWKSYLSSDNVVDNLNSTSSTSVLSAKQGKILNDNKQDLLISGTNIKTINSQSLLGNGDITISGEIELIDTTNNSNEELAATSTTLSEVKEGTMILLKIINPFNTMRADSRLTLTLKNGEVLNRKLMKHPDFANYLPSNIVPSNTIFLMRYHDSTWFIIDQYNLATQSFRGFMSAEDKARLDNTYTKAEVDALIGSGGSVNIRTSSTGFSSTLTDTEVPSEKLIKEYVDNAIGSIQNFIHS